MVASDGRDAGRSLLILGTRGVPAAHGGFETFAEQLSLYLVRRGWDVGVYCQEDGAAPGQAWREEDWQGVRRIVVPTRGRGSLGSVLFDLACVLDSRRRKGRVLVLGYNTGLFMPLLRLFRCRVWINMDGIEWKRSKWSRPVRLWFRINERIAARFGTTLIADHPAIEDHLRAFAPATKTTMIPYGAPLVERAPTEPLAALGLEPDGYFLVICRIEPENSVLNIVRAYAARPRSLQLAILGRLDSGNPYHRAVAEAANEGVRFLGAIYDKAVLASLRAHARAYGHGHTVGGTNPSLVEALGAGSAVIAHDNPFNRWTAGEEQFFFRDESACAAILDRLCTDRAAVAQAREAARARFTRSFRNEDVLSAYEAVLSA